MDDAQIVDLYWARSELAIHETTLKYKNYCLAIARSVLGNGDDADEALNDTYLAAWNSMPPHRPSVLSTFLGKITRRISIDKWHSRSAAKRGGGEIDFALDELSECIPSPNRTEQVVEQCELSSLINVFLSTLEEKERDVFVCRYWFLSPVKEISSRFGISESKTKTMLFRTRKRLCAYLQKEGYR